MTKVGTILTFLIAMVTFAHASNGKWMGSVPKIQQKHNAPAVAADIMSLLAGEPAPSGLSIFPRHKELQIIWQKVDGAASYTVFYGTDSTDLNALEEKAGITDTFTTLTGLENGVFYYVAVSAGGDTSSFLAAVPTLEAGNAIRLNGIDQYGMIEDGDGLDVGAQITLEAWVKPLRISTQHFVSKHNGEDGHSGYALYMNEDGTVSFFIGNGVDWIYPYVQSTEILEIGKYYHLAGTFDGDSLRLYINGSLAAKGSAAGPILENNEPLLFGFRRGGYNDGWYQGEIDEVRLWRKALTQSEINNRKDKKLLLPVEDLVAYWNFDEPTGSIIYDGTYRGANGNMVGGPLRIASQAMYPFPFETTSEETTQGIALSWPRNRAADVDKYLVFRGNEPGFDTSAAMKLRVTADTFYVDNNNIPCGVPLYYQVFAEDELGNKSIASTSTIIPTFISPEFTEIIFPQGDDTSFCQGAFVRFHVKQGATSYQWYSGDQKIPNATDSAYTATLSGAYQVIITKGSCKDTSRSVFVKAVLPPSAELRTNKTFLCGQDTATLSVTPLNGNSFRFKGTTDSYLSNDTVTLTFDGAIGVEMWVKAPSSSSPNSTLICYTAKNVLGAKVFSISDPTNLTLSILTSLNGLEHFQTGVSIADDLWHYIAFSANKKVAAFYLDGKLLKTQEFSIANFSNALLTGRLVVGQNQDNFSNPFSNSFLGEMDEMRFWLKGLDSSSVKNNYKSRLSGKEEGLYVMVHLDDTVGSSYAKEEVRENHLAIHNVDIIEGGGIAEEGGIQQNYSWFKDGEPLPWANGPKVRVSEKGVYFLALSNGTCAAQSNLVQIQKPAFVENIPVLKDTFACQRDSISIGVPALANVSFSWSNQKTSSYIKVKQGVYSLLVDSANSGCAVSRNIRVYYPNFPRPSVGDTTLCNFHPIVISPGISPPFTASLSRIGTPTLPLSSFSVQIPDTYLIHVDSAGVCTLTDTFQVFNKNFEAKIASPTSTDTTLCGENKVEIAAFNYVGAGFQYQWLKEGMPIPGANNAILNVTESSSYAVRVDSLGCADTSRTVGVAFVSTPPLPTFSLAPNYCKDVALPIIAISGSGRYRLYVDEQLRDTIQGASLDLSQLGVAQEGSYSLGLQPIVGECIGDIERGTLTINPIPPSPIFSPIPDICRTASLPELRLTGNGNATFKLTNKLNGTSITNLTGAFSANALEITSQQEGSVPLEATQIISGCESIAARDTLVILPKSDMPSIVSTTGRNLLCEGSNVVLQASSGFSSYQWYWNGYKIMGATNQTYLAVVDGEYRVEATNAIKHECDEPSAAFRVTLTASFEVPSIRYGFQDGFSTLISQSTGSQYQWYVNGKQIIGANGRQLITKFSGNYAVRVTYAENCSAISSLMEVNESGYEQALRVGTAVGDSAIILPSSISTEIQVFPNPFRDNLTLNLPSHPVSEIVLSDMSGRMIMTLAATSSRVTMNIATLSPGVYVLKVNGANGSEAFLVQKVE